MKVGLDLDNVLVDILCAARSALANDHNIPLDQIEHTYNYGSPFGHRDPTIAALLATDHAFWCREDVLSSAPPLPGAITAARRLYDAGLLSSYVTRRPPSVSSITEQWLKKHHFPSVPAFHVGGEAAEHLYSRCKSTACHERGVTHMVDDQPREAATMIAAGIQVILVDASTGRAARQEFLTKHPRIPIAGSIAEAADMLLKDFAQAA